MAAPDPLGRGLEDLGDDLDDLRRSRVRGVALHRRMIRAARLPFDQRAHRFDPTLTPDHRTGVETQKNRRQRVVSFDEAMTVFADWESITIPDPDHSAGEERFLIVGSSSRGQVLVVSHAERGDNIRIISARRADARERREHVR